MLVVLVLGLELELELVLVLVAAGAYTGIIGNAVRKHDIHSLHSGNRISNCKVCNTDTLAGQNYALVGTLASLLSLPSGAVCESFDCLFPLSLFFSLMGSRIAVDLEKTTPLLLLLPSTLDIEKI